MSENMLYKLPKEMLIKIIENMSNPENIEDDELLFVMYKAFRKEYVKRTDQYVKNYTNNPNSEENKQKVNFVLINDSYGGFHLSNEVIQYYETLTGKKTEKYYGLKCKRDDPDLIQAVKTIGLETSSKRSELTIVPIPKDIEFEIKEYDGAEWIAEEHREFS